MYKAVFKRLFDISIASIAFLFFLPLMVLVAIVLKLQKRQPVFFVQERPGLHEKSFHLIKFCTMNNRVDEKGNLLPDAERLTKTGRFLRYCSMDELPQLWHVIVGEMSLVGPRPLLKQYLPLYTPEQRLRHSVKPGITGWAQVNGRNNISWQQKFDLDIYYVHHLSFGLDLKILWLTFLKVISREGVTKAGSATTEIFAGQE